MRACRAPAGNASSGSLLSGTDLAGLLEDSFSMAEVGEALITRFLDLLP